MRSHPRLELAASHGVKLGLERVRDLLTWMGSPHLGRHTVHVAGTNGKGSTCAMTTACLVAAGHRVGTFLSPHLVDVNERILVDGRPVDDDLLSEALDAAAEASAAFASAHGRPDDPLTYFELTLVAAWWIFERMGVEVQVIEVGIGGRLDATNVVEPTVAAIVSVGMDHVEVLGPDLASIAREKAGILKPGRPGVVGSLPPEAARVVRRVSEEVGASLDPAPGALGWEGGVGEGRGVLCGPDGERRPVSLGLAGRHQTENAKVVLGIVSHLRDQGLSVPVSAVAEGLERARLAGRLMEVRRGWWVDGAHNPEGASALAAALKSGVGPSRPVLVFGCGRERDPVALVAPLRDQISSVLAVQAAHPAARSADEVAAHLAGLELPVTVGGRIQEVWASLAGREPLLFAGSLYLIGELMERLQGDAEAGSGP